MIHARVEVVKNTNSAVVVNNKLRNGVTALVELDQFKSVMLAYEEPLAEMRDSL